MYYRKDSRDNFEYFELEDILLDGYSIGFGFANIFLGITALINGKLLFDLTLKTIFLLGAISNRY